jgi:Tol biopolymer transport system component
MRRLAICTAAAAALSCDSPVEPLRDPRGVLLVVVGFRHQAEIYAMRPDGTARQRLTNNNVAEADPAWSPDGRMIVYIGFDDSIPGAPARRGDVYVMNANGSGKRRIVQVPVQAWHPRWSPDGTRISYESIDPVVGGFRAYIANADGSNPQPVADQPGETFHVEWKPDGSRLLFLSNRSPRNWWTAYTINPNGTDEQLLAGDEACTSNIGSATWSRDGQRIVFDCTAKAGLFTMNANGTNVMPVPGTTLAGAGGAVWSPDDATLAFVSNQKSDCPTVFQCRQIWDVFTVPASGGSPVRITSSDTMHIVTSWGGPR